MAFRSAGQADFPGRLRGPCRQAGAPASTYFIDTHPKTKAFVKNMGLGFAIPYFHNGQAHDYVPDFLVLLNKDRPDPSFLILETKGFDPLEAVKRAAAERWVKAVNAAGRFGHWQYAVAHKPSQVVECLNTATDHEPGS